MRAVFVLVTICYERDAGKGLLERIYSNINSDF